MGSVGIAVAAVAMLPSAASAATRGAASCSYDAVAGELEVLAGNPKEMSVTVGREGDEITVDDTLSGKPRPVSCAGGRATVQNTDLIVVDATFAELEQDVAIDLSGGPLAPGRTAEADGSSEIELDVTINQRGRKQNASLLIYGSDSDEAVTFGQVAGDTGANLNADESSPDIDLVLHQRLESRPTSQVLLGAVLGGGSDRADASGVVPFDGAIELGYGDVWFQGGGGDDTLVGGLEGDSLQGGEGDDALDGGPGDDWLTGGQGADTIDAGDGKNVITGGSDDDQLTGGPEKDRIFAGKGADQVAAEGGDDRIAGGKGPDDLDGGDGNDRLHGDGGSDELRGGNGDDRLGGEAGPDRLFGEAGDDVLQGDRRWGPGSDDTLVGGAGEDAMNGQGGDDLFKARDGFVDWIVCGDGDDTVRADASDRLKQCDEKPLLASSVPGRAPIA